MKGHLFNIEDAKWAHEKWCMGYTHIEIAEAMSVSPKTVDRSLKRYGFRKVRKALPTYIWGGGE